MFQDWSANKENPKARLILTAFRLANRVSTLRKPWIYMGYPYVVFYRIVFEWIFGVELPWKLRVGSGLKLHHGHALVVNDRAVLGRNCLLRHCTTIGVAETNGCFEGEAPVIGDNVDIGCNVVILGGITIGDNAVIGAGSVVIRDVPAGAVVAGNPARVIRIREIA